MWAWLGWIAGTAASLGERVLHRLAFPRGEPPWRPPWLADVGWLAGSKDNRELAAPLGYPDGRKFRLLLVASCRKGLDCPDEHVRAALDVAESYADGLATADELHAAQVALWTSPSGSVGPRPEEWAIPLLTVWEPDWVGVDELYHLVPAFIQDIWSDPSRPVVFDPAWLSDDVKALARAAYEERTPMKHLDNARLAVLSDALEEAGCSDEATLAHLRSPGPHVRGCWALDLVLGKG